MHRHSLLQGVRGIREALTKVAIRCCAIDAQAAAATTAYSLIVSICLSPGCLSIPTSHPMHALSLSLFSRLST